MSLDAQIAQRVQSCGQQTGQAGVLGLDSLEGGPQISTQCGWRLRRARPSQGGLQLAVHALQQRAVFGADRAAGAQGLIQLDLQLMETLVRHGEPA